MAAIEGPRWARRSLRCLQWAPFGHPCAKENTGSGANSLILRKLGTSGGRTRTYDLRVMSVFRGSRVSPVKSASCCFHNSLGTPRALCMPCMRSMFSANLVANWLQVKRLKFGRISYSRAVAPTVSRHHGRETKLLVAMSVQQLTSGRRSQSRTFASLTTLADQEHPTIGSPHRSSSDSLGRRRQQYAALCRPARGFPRPAAPR